MDHVAREASEEPPHKQRKTTGPSETPLERDTAAVQTKDDSPADLTTCALSEFVRKSRIPTVLDPAKPLSSVTTPLHAAKLAGFRAAVAAKGAALILLAAGQGSRFRASVPKVIHQFAGKPLARHGIDAAAEAGLPTIVVVGHARELVGEKLEIHDKEQVVFVCQERQMGTGHAVYLATFALPQTFDGEIIVSYADNPGVDKALLEEILEAHKGNAERYGDRYGAMVVTGSRAAAGKGAAAYGRIVRKGKGSLGPVVDIVEKKTIARMEADGQVKTYNGESWTARELDEIDEFNSGIVVARNKPYVDVLGGIVASQTKFDPPEYEYYATDFVKGLVTKGFIAEGYRIEHSNMWKLEGANTLEELQELERKHIARLSEVQGQGASK